MFLQVELLRVVLDVVESKDWDKLDWVLVDVQIDYIILMRVLGKGYRQIFVSLVMI